MLRKISVMQAIGLNIGHYFDLTSFWFNTTNSNPDRILSRSKNAELVKSLYAINVDKS